VFEEEVKVEIEAESKGEDAYDKHQRGLKRVKDTAEETNEELQTLALTNIQLLESLNALNSGISSTTRGLTFFLGGNEAINAALQTMSASLGLVVGAMQIYKGISSLTAAIDWGRAAAGIAANLWLAPVVAGIIATALLTLTSSGAQFMAHGGSGIVTEPTIFVAGESGPEFFSFIPTGAGGISGAPTTIGNVDITIVTNDPDIIGEAVTTHLRKLAGRGA
jgi:hypothetical protein